MNIKFLLDFLLLLNRNVFVLHMNGKHDTMSPVILPYRIVRRRELRLCYRTLISQ
jgi:hypothetical protein